MTDLKITPEYCLHNVTDAEDYKNTKIITIWIEGYPGYYNEKAALFAVVQATDLDDAVHKLLENNARGSQFIQKNNKNHWHVFGCRLFDNEKDAKKRNG